nr:MAG TPA: hypothetical protein [Caudoviricetes sp.]
MWQCRRCWGLCTRMGQYCPWSQRHRTGRSTSQRPYRISNHWLHCS